MSAKKFMSYGDAEAVFTGFANAIKNKKDEYETITYEQWQAMTPQQRAEKDYYISDYPSSQLMAGNIGFDNTGTGMEADDVHEAIVELHDDLEGAWEEVNLSSIFTPSQDLTLDTENSKAYRRGKCIRLRLNFTGALSIGASGEKIIGTLSSGNRPKYTKYHQCLVNTNTSTGRTFLTGQIATYNSGNCNLYCNKYSSDLGNNSYSWNANYFITIEYEV